MKRIVVAVTNDLTYDQRMIRICTSLSRAGYPVTMVGTKFKTSLPLTAAPYEQKRLSCLFTRGKLFYLEYNIRLFFYLLFKKSDIVCAIDLDTILPCYFISRLKKLPRIYDAHELFCEMKEIVTRPKIYRIWKRVEQFAVPGFEIGYTVNHLISMEFKKMYGVDYDVIRNVPVLLPLTIREKAEKFILYQGAVNEGRSFETLIPAMKEVNARLLIFGEGNFFEQARQLITKNNLMEKVILKGKVLPAELTVIAPTAWIGVTLFDKTGLSNYYSLGNRFFDYIHAGLPQLCVDFPIYRELNNQYPVAVLINDLSTGSIAKELNRLLNDYRLYNDLQENCLRAREVWNWQEEERKLLSFYKRIQ